MLALVTGVAALTLATPAQAATTDESTPPVLFVGVTGLRWDDVSTLTTPTLWQLSREGAPYDSALRPDRG